MGYPSKKQLFLFKKNVWPCLDCPCSKFVLGIITKVKVIKSTEQQNTCQHANLTPGYFDAPKSSSRSYLGGSKFNWVSSINVLGHQCSVDTFLY